MPLPACSSYHFFCVCMLSLKAGYVTSKVFEEYSGIWAKNTVQFDLSFHRHLHTFHEFLCLEIL